jgi:Family of unknown function (DUF5989)
MVEQIGNDFEAVAARGERGSICTDFWGFLLATRKWWLLPVLLVLLLLGGLMLLSASAAAPFIYTLF